MENIDLIEKVRAVANREDDCFDIKVSTFDDNDFTVAKCWDGGFADYLRKSVSDYIETKKRSPKSKEETDDFNEKYDDHLDESSKVTVTLGQLKRLVREWHSFDDEEESEEGGKWEVCYKDKSGDITTVWVRARDAEEAEDKVRDEYWDVVRIVCIEKM